MKCPVCETEYTPNEVETCSVCGYDLTPYPPIIGGIPSGFLEKEKKRIAAAKRVWQLSQSQVESAQLMVSHLQSQLDEMTRKIDGFTQSQSQLESQIEAIASSQLQSQSQLESQIEAIASQLQPMVEQVQETPIVSSSSSFDYTELNRLLKSGNWLDAEIKTQEIMLAVAGRTPRGGLDEDDIKNFPGEDLRIIDGLWVKHSNGHFGFSVQKQIYINCGFKDDGSYIKMSVDNNFFKEVGWQMDDFDLIKFSLFGAPRGHLPILYYITRNRKKYTLLNKPYFSRSLYIGLMLRITQKLVA
ncbi:GUN4 domain-containing protein [Arthrospira platensis]|uniref:GUN4 domain-containing protein n=1 Tax=Limnospira TaxID=2596745 RepID=UPI0009042B7D|nr:GUN4 domain-containing protein [Arthrospira platensis]MBD2671630.1 GUN4 domain-containing protein [Arthrospira platensis FACHB-439]MBD2712554.1 GUN4 domain-containing protein [Arthrospira platensis FACHB-835]MDT9313338.1 GUN4 domain-containing protein [Limnospira sp. Paracas R14]QQW28668.1 GUN4 domain-containing protein [Arthrospira sp. PCC 9108]MBD2575501.1 GUN4 domain-containing protein [Arthrospira platensis FACHB-971]